MPTRTQAKPKPGPEPKPKPKPGPAPPPATENTENLAEEFAQMGQVAVEYLMNSGTYTGDVALAAYQEAFGQPYSTDTVIHSGLVFVPGWGTIGIATAEKYGLWTAEGLVSEIPPPPPGWGTFTGNEGVQPGMAGDTGVAAGGGDPDTMLYQNFVASLGGYFNLGPDSERGGQDANSAATYVVQSQGRKPQPQGGDPIQAGAFEESLFGELGLPSGIPAEWQDIIDQAIREDWTMTRFESAIIGSRQFDRMFPNIKRADGSLRMSASEYRTLQEAYEEVGYEFGIGINRFRTGLLIEGGVSPDEFARRAQAIQNVRGNPELRDSYNEQLRLAGISPLDEQGFFRFVAGAAGTEYYDAYEGALLATSGLNITQEQARGTAAKIGQPGEPIDIRALVADVRQLLPDAGPELMQAGINDADLVSLAAGVDPRGIAPTLQTIVANRRAQGSYVAGSQARRGSGGGLAILPQEESAAYG